jgi:cytochrome c oxidase subunit 2
MTIRVRSARLAAASLSLLVFAACGTGTPGVARGEAVYDTCRPCHGEAGEGNQAVGAPAIAGLPRWYIASQLTAFENAWRGAHPQDTVGIRMKSMARTFDVEGDLESVADYVATLPRLEHPATLVNAEGAHLGNATAGEQVYTTVCAGCHLPDAAGFEGSQAPPLLGQHDWYMLAQYQKYLRGWRGTHADDVWGRTMQESTARATEAQALDALAYIQTLPLAGAQAGTQ